MKIAVLCNGPSRVAFEDSLEYNYVIGCNVPWTVVDSTIIMDTNVVDAWANNFELIKVPVYFSSKAWMRTDEIRIRKYLHDNNRFAGLIDGPYPSAGHFAALIAIQKGATHLDIFGCDSMFEHTVKSYTDTLLNDVNEYFQLQRVENWRAAWKQLQDGYPEVSFNFIKDSK
jgi:hypothetical protein